MRHSNAFRANAKTVAGLGIHVEFRLDAGLFESQIRLGQSDGGEEQKGSCVNY